MSLLAKFGLYVLVGVSLGALDIALSRWRARQWVSFREFAMWVLLWPVMLVLMAALFIWVFLGPGLREETTKGARRRE